MTRIPEYFLTNTFPATERRGKQNALLKRTQKDFCHRGHKGHKGKRLAHPLFFFFTFVLFVTFVAFFFPLFLYDFNRAKTKQNKTK